MSRKVYAISSILAVLLFVASAFYYMPYYVTKPGMAKELESIIDVSGGDRMEKGSFMLTTVRMGRANIYSYLLAKWSKYQEIYPESSIRFKDETEAEYDIRQLHLMDNSKNNAIKVAYDKAGKNVTLQHLGVYVLDVYEDMPAVNFLKAGDQIIQVDNMPLKSAQQFIKKIATKNAGDHISIVYKREGAIKKAIIPLKKFRNFPNHVGIGISLDDYTKVKTNPHVSINSEQIGGPSAGLMFTLEIYNQLTKGDLTKGYQIAGTGTMDEKGKVGPIGGIEQKIVAADHSGAEIFFAPNEGGATHSNYRDSLMVAKDIHTKMKIIPVDRFEDALNYLDKLKAK